MINDKEYEIYLKSLKNRKIKIKLIRFLIIIIFIGMWQLLADLNIIDVFLFSSPHRIAKLIPDLFINYNLAEHIGATMLEIIISFSIATILGIGLAVILWLSDTVTQALEPFIVAINSLPKIAIAPIIIV